MKFMHLGDLHIGKSLGDFDLYADQEFILNQILDIAVEKQVHAILIAGDVYDKAIPSEAAVRLFDEFICKSVERKLKVFIISGNHDSDERLNFGSSLFATNNVFISAKYNGELKKYSVVTEEGSANVYLMPFVKASQVKRYFPDENINTYDDAVRVLINGTEINEDEINVLVAHQFVVGGSIDPNLGGSESISVKNVGTVEKINSDCFDKFDYVALGHIHSAQKVGRNEVRYSGSPLKYSLSEVNSEKSVPIVSISDKGNTSIELVKLKPMRDLRHIKGKMEILLDKNNVSEPEDFMYVTLTDEDIINDAMGIFQQTYPNTVKIDYDNSRTKEIDQVDISKISENRSFMEMVSDFYKQMYQRDISEDEIKVMKAVAKEVGVTDEAD